MQIGAYGSDSLMNINAVAEVEVSKRYTKVESQTTPSGDSVDISDEAKKLFSEMIHKYDTPSASTGDNTQQEENSGSGQGAGGAGGSEESTDDVETIKKQIQSLKSQMSSLASQMDGGAGDSAAMSKINALQAQIAALEAQLNAMATA